MKKLTSIALAIALTMSLAACSSSSGSSATASSEPTAAESTATVEPTAVESERTESEVAETTATTEENSDTIVVGVSWAADDISEDIQAYLDAVEKAGGEAVYLPQIETEEDAIEALSGVDALVMTGGEDIDPSYYGEEPYEYLEEVNDVRDVSDSILLEEALDEDLPILATCRGMQFLNVVCGGTLYQDFPSQYETDVEVIHRDPQGEDWVTHTVTVDDGNIVATAFGGAGTYDMYSWHHQAVNKLGDNLTVVATTSDGIVEAIVKDDSTYVMGLQFHPEAMIAAGYDEYLGFYTELIAAAQAAK